MESRVELAVLDSTAPTTLVDMTRLIVRRTPLFTDYTKLKSSYYEAVSSKLEDDLLCFANKTPKSSLNDWRLEKGKKGGL
jgi:hypothetical protein